MNDDTSSKEKIVSVLSKIHEIIGHAIMEGYIEREFHLPPQKWIELAELVTDINEPLQSCAAFWRRISP